MLKCDMRKNRLPMFAGVVRPLVFEPLEMDRKVATGGGQAIGFLS